MAAAIALAVMSRLSPADAGVHAVAPADTIVRPDGSVEFTDKDGTRWTSDRFPGLDTPLPDPVDTLPGRLVALPGLTDLAAMGPRVLEPGGLAIDAFGRFVVTDVASHRIVRFDRNGAWLGEAGSLGSDPGQLRRPIAVTTLGSLGVAVLDRENRRVVSYDLMGRRIGVMVDFAAKALAEIVGRIDAIAMTSDRGGALYVADADRDRILVFDFQGRYQRSIGGYGTKPGAFRGLGAIATTPRGELVVVERTGQRVQIIDAGGRVVRSWALEIEAGRSPLAVAVDDSSRIALTHGSRGNLLDVFDRFGRLWASSHQLVDARALAFAPDGSLLVAEGIDDGQSRIRRFALAPAPRGTPLDGD